MAAREPSYRFTLLRRALPPVLVVLALGLHAIVLVCYAFRWDRAAAVTTVPLLVWTAVGVSLLVLAWLASPAAGDTGYPNRVALFRRPSPWVLSAVLVWMATYLLLGDEPPGLVRGLVRDPPAAAARTPGTTLRVATLNCRDRNTEAALELEAFQPDIIFYQESPHRRALDEITQRLYGNEGSFIHTYDVSIAARGKLRARSPHPSRHWLQASLTLADGREIEIAGVHLTGAVTSLSLWRRSTWKAYYRNRLQRRSEVTDLLAEVIRAAGPRPAIIAGDFNAPPPDAIFRDLAVHFRDTYHQAGTGWSNTFSNTLPILRIDQIWTTPEFAAAAHGTYKSVASDHRFVVADLTLAP
ncbi:hypothetical protein BH23VER1_BH23VER1_37560 [soil metagenome]